MKSNKKNRPLRIAMLGHKRIPSREGGIEVVVAELATRMAEQGFPVTCYNRRGHHVSGSDFDKKYQKEYCGVRIKRVLTIDKKGLAAMTSSFFAALRSAFGRYDVVHFHAEGPCAMLWLPKLFGKKCIATIHGLDHRRGKWGKFASKYILFGEKCAVRFADEIIVLSEGVKQYFQDTYGRETVLIPNGITRPMPAPPQAIEERFGLTKNSYILSLGRLVPEKGIQYLIPAFQQVKTEKRLVIAGGSSDAKEFEIALRELAKDDPRILFTGFVQGAILEELFSNAYLYAMPSDLEGMPMSLLEAMSYGNCCLTSDIPECSDVIGACGATFRRGDIDHLREQLQYLCDNPDVVESYQKSSADYICSRYDWADITNRTLQLYGVIDQNSSEAPVEEKEHEGAACQ